MHYCTNQSAGDMYISSEQQGEWEQGPAPVSWEREIRGRDQARLTGVYITMKLFVDPPIEVDRQRGRQSALRSSSFPTTPRAS